MDKELVNNNKVVAKGSMSKWKLVMSVPEFQVGTGIFNFLSVT